MRYHGGKWNLAPELVKLFPAHRTYVEPFCGAASVLLRKPRSYSEVINDLDGEIVGLFKVMRDPNLAARLVECVELTPFAREEFEAAYEPSDDPVEQARRTLVKSFMGFGSSAVTQASPTVPGAGFRSPTAFRANSARAGTAPATYWRKYPAKIAAFTDRLRGVVVENRDAKKCAAQHDARETLFYLDPPYPHSTRRGRQWRRCKNYRHELDDDGHRGLASWVRELSGMVVVSGYACPLYEELYGDWHRAEFKITDGTGAKRVESVWLNPAACDVGLFGGAL